MFLPLTKPLENNTFLAFHSRAAATMKGSNCPRPHSWDARAAPPSKRRRSSERRPHNHRKRRHADAETLSGAPKPDPTRLITGSNSFNFLRSSHQRRRKHRRLETSGVGNPRKWVYPSRDSSSYKGSKFTITPLNF